MNKVIKYLIFLFSFVLVLSSGALLSFKNGVYWFSLSSLLTLIIVYFFGRKKYSFSIDKLILIVFFVLIVFIPFTGKKETTSLENRKLADIPEWRWSNVWRFFKDYQNYFNDRFAYRNKILETHRYIKYDVLDLSKKTKKVVEGEDEWLFLSFRLTIEHLAIPFNQKELRQFNYNKTVIKQWFKNRGINYYLTIPPGKHTIYKEKMPDELKVMLSFSRLDQLTNYLAEKSASPPFIDYREELFREKKTTLLYDKKDTHWNDYGAFIGYSKIINVIAKDYPQVVPNKISEYTIGSDQKFIGDLTRMLGLNKTDEPSITFLKKDSLNAKLNKQYLDENKIKFQDWEMPECSNDLKLMVVHDSYSQRLKKFFSTNFKSSTYAWTPDLPIHKINENKPDVIIHEVAERVIQEYLELPPEIKNDTAFINQFNISDF